MTEKPAIFELDALGTRFVINLYHTNNVSIEGKIFFKITSLISEFEKVYSRFLPDSFISHLRNKTGTFKISDDFKEILALFKQLYFLTDGLFTPFIGSTLESLGYDSEYSFAVSKLQKIPKWETAIEIQNNMMKIKSPVSFDFGALGKGYVIDKIGELLVKNDVRDFCVDAGGDIYKQGNKKIIIGLEHPNDFNKVIGTVELLNGSICGSSGNRRKWGKYHHIINPKTESSPKNILATWVRADNAFTADGLATCLFLVNPETLLRHFDFEYLILRSDYSVIYSAHFGAELF